MAGGVGSRFWPESRQNVPKQFLDILGTGYSLIQSTFLRLKNICPPERIFVITHESYVDMCSEHLPEIPKENIIGEPFRKNTAPAAAYINYKIMSRDPEARLILCPSDHLIINESLFAETVIKGLDYVAQQKVILTLGIRPTRPDTGYGYIQYDAENGDNGFHKVITFTEKPNLELARTFLKSGDFLWNSGMFLWHVKTFTKALHQHLPEIADLFEKVQHIYYTPKEKNVVANIYSQCTNISIDYGIMEKVANAYTIPSHFGWSDLGTWESAYEHSEKDYEGNAVLSKQAILIDASNNFVKLPKDKLAVIQGLDNFIIVDTGEILLICERRNEQEIKEYVAEVKRLFGEQFL